MKTAPTLTRVLCALVLSATSTISLTVNAKGLDDSLYVFDFVRDNSITVEQKAKQWSEMVGSYDCQGHRVVR